MADDWQSAWVEVLPDFSNFRNTANPQITSALGAAGASGATAFKGSFFGQVFGGSFLANIASNAVSNILTAVTTAVQSGVQFAFDGIQLASDLGETISAVGEIFGDSADDIVDWADTAVSRLGQTRQQALNAIKTFGALGNAAGLTGPDLTSFSTSLVDLATDLASFNNTDVDTALNALRSGLSGEAEPLRQYQVFLNDAALKQKALELGIYDGSGALTDQQRILAAYNVVLDRTQIQQGDFARTQDGLAQQQKILAAAFEETQTTLGEFLLPGFTAVVTYANENLIPKLGEVIDRVGPKLAAAFEESAPEISDLGDNLVGFVERTVDAFADGGLDDAIDTLQQIVDFGDELVDAFAWANDPNAQPAAFLNGLQSALDTAADAIYDFTHQRGSSPIGSILDPSSLVPDEVIDELRDRGQLAGEGLGEGVGWGVAAQNEANAARLGESFSAGLAVGISRGTSGVVGAAVSVAAAAEMAVRKRLKISSPSKVMAELGGYAAEGFALGWNEQPMLTPRVDLPSFSTRAVSSASDFRGGGFDPTSLMRALRDYAERDVTLAVDGETVARASISGSARLSALGAN